MAIPADFRYLCTMEGRTFYVHGVASVDRIHFSRFPFNWTCAISESYMQRLLSNKNIRVVWYQREFDFDI